MANTFKQYTDSIYLTASTSIITVCFVVVSFKMKTIFELIDRFEFFLNKSKYSKKFHRENRYDAFIHILGLENSASEAIYIKTNQFVENLSDIVYTAVVQISPLIWVMPKCLGSLLFYFTTDLGNDAFESPLPLWYVR